MKRLWYLVALLTFADCSKAPFTTRVDTVSTTEIAADKPIGFIKPGKLVALVNHKLTSYYLVKGQPRGFEYELLRAFAKDNHLDLQIKIIPHQDYLLDSLEAGKGDIAIGNIAISGELSQTVGFSPSILESKTILVQKERGHKSKISDPIQLAGKKIHIGQNSTFRNSLIRYNEENAMNMDVVLTPSTTTMDDLFQQVSNGDIEFTIADQNEAKILEGHYPNLNIQTPISLSKRIGWAYNLNNDTLNAMITEWVINTRNTSKYRIIYNKYFNHSGNYRKKHLLPSSESISDIDHLIKVNAKKIGWDWRLVAAMINKESAFNPMAESPYGAKGLMQLLPTTAERFDLFGDSIFIPSENIRAGTEFIQWLDKKLANILDDQTDRKQFVMASYNAGLGHVLDARRLAKKNGTNPDNWDDVAEMLLLLSNPEYHQSPEVKYGYCRGKEPVNYVYKIMEYYNLYAYYAAL